MNTSQFLAEFGTLAAAPNGVQRLREMILQLAVMGKLVPQDPADEPASVLLQRIAQTKSNTVSNLASMKNEDKPFGIPKSWEWVKVGSIISIRRGASPRPKGDPKYFSEKPTSYHWIKISDLKRHGRQNTLYGTDEYLTKAGTEKSVLVRKGTLIITNSATIGVPIIMGIDGYIHDGFLSFPDFPQENLSQDFFLIALRALTSYLKDASRGLAQLNMNSSIMREAPFALPPLAEQKRIVAKVDSLMALCDKLETLQQQRQQLDPITHNAVLQSLAQTPDDLQRAWQRLNQHMTTLFHTPESVKALRETILQLAVMGKLVPQDPNDEPAAVLLQHIAAEKDRLIQAGKIKRQKPLPAIRDDEKPFELPNGWEWVRIDDIFNVQGGIQKTPKRKPINNYFPYLRVANVQRGYMTLDQIEYFEIEDGELEKYTLNEGDILIVEGNGSAEEIGRCAIWHDQIKNCVHQNHLIRIRGFFVATGLFSTKFLNSPLGISEMKRLSITTSGLYTLSVGKIRSICIPLPPLAEQKRIVAKVDSLMALCDKLEKRLQAARETAGLFAAEAVEKAGHQ